MSRKSSYDLLKALDKRVTIRLSAYHFEAVEKIALREGFTSSQIIRHLVTRFVENDMFQKAVPKKTRPRSPMTVIPGGKS